MTLLSPLGLLGLLSVPALVWLWRFAGARHRSVIPSLVPFEHLLRRAPRRRSRLLVNALFWLQLAALACIALALAQPAITAKPARTILVVIDTSASMAARLRGDSPLEHAKRWLIQRIARGGTSERWFLVASAPVAGLTRRPTSDALELRQLIDAVEAADLGGNLSMAVQIGRALLGRRPDETVVLTDEPVPAWFAGAAHAPGWHIESFGRPLANVGVVGLSVYEPLCPMTPLDASSSTQGPAASPVPAPTAGPEDAQVAVTLQNFSSSAQTVEVQALRGRDVLARASQTLEPDARAPVRLALPQSGEPVEIRLSAGQDALAVDSRVRVALRGERKVEAVVVSENPAFARAVGRWLDACRGIGWRSINPATAGSQPPPAEPASSLQASGARQIVITDRVESIAGSPAGSGFAAESAIVFAASGRGRIVPSHWILEAPHPIGEYLQPIGATLAALAVDAADSQQGDPVLWAVLQGRRVPLARVSSVQGRRTVSLLIDPTAGASSVPELLLFLNSLRWLASAERLALTGEPLSVEFGPGLVQIHTPAGRTELRDHDGGVLSFEATDRAGRYVLSGDGRVEEHEVSFLDPAESDTLTRASSLRPELAQPSRAVDRAPEAAAVEVRRGLAEWLLAVVLALLLGEWLLYIRHHRHSVVGDDARVGIRPSAIVDRRTPSPNNDTGLVTEHRSASSSIGSR